MESSQAGYDPEKFRHRELTERVIGVFYDVYNELGFGFLESVYHRAMFHALTEAGLLAETEVGLPVYYRGQLVSDFSADLVVERKLILELKAVEELHPAHEAQLLNYLKASPIELGLLINFGPKPRIRRHGLLQRPQTLPPASIRTLI